jgi:hypothetical protein
MKKIKLSLKREIISDLQSKNIKGGIYYTEYTDCKPKTHELSRCLMCDKTQELTCFTR